MSFAWPPGFDRAPDDGWTTQPLDSLALHYDSVENHGWYRNLDPTVDAVARTVADGDLIVDYSGGTGIFTDRLLRRLGEAGDGPACGVMIADSSPKFLRLALEKLGGDPRVAFRRIRWLADERRLELLEEALGPELTARGAEVLVSTNAIHLYYDLADTLASWRRVVRDGHVFVQSGNIANPDAPDGAWIIDETVEHIHRAALELVQRDDRWARFRPHLAAAEHLATHDELRRKIFLPVRPLGHYLETLAAAGFEVAASECRPIEARVDDWYEFLAVYHEGVLGWAGGAEKVTGREADEDTVALRRRLLRAAMDRVFAGSETFAAAWTYLTCR